MQRAVLHACLPACVRVLLFVAQITDRNESIAGSELMTWVNKMQAIEAELKEESDRRCALREPVSASAWRTGTSTGSRRCMCLTALAKSMLQEWAARAGKQGGHLVYERVHESMPHPHATQADAAGSCLWWWCRRVFEQELRELQATADQLRSRKGLPGR